MNNLIKTRKGNPNWIKGFIPNPKGRPKGGKNIPSMLKKVGDTLIPEDVEIEMRKIFNFKQRMTMREAVWMRIYHLAAKGSIQAAELIAEREEGKPIQSLNLSSPPGPLIQIIRPPLEMKPVIEAEVIQNKSLEEKQNKE